MTSTAYRRLIYTSRATGDDFAPILQVSRANNGIDGVSGLLLARDGVFVQLLEGPPDSVGKAFSRISRDSRHSDIEVLSDTDEDERVFGDWTMAGLPGEDDALIRHRLSLLTSDAPAAVRKAFAEI